MFRARYPCMRALLSSNPSINRSPQEKKRPQAIVKHITPDHLSPSRSFSGRARARARENRAVRVICGQKHNSSRSGITFERWPSCIANILECAYPEINGAQSTRVVRLGDSSRRWKFCVSVPWQREGNLSLLTRVVALAPLTEGSTMSGSQSVSGQYFIPEGFLMFFPFCQLKRDYREFIHVLLWVSKITM